MEPQEILQGSFEGGRDVPPAAMSAYERTQVRAGTMGRLMGTSYEMAFTSHGLQPSAESALMDRFYDYTQELQQFSENPPEGDQCIAASQSIVKQWQADVKNLPEGYDPLLQQRDMQASVRVGEKMVEDGRQNEVQVMQQIDKLLEGSAEMPDARKRRPSYIVVQDGKTMINRSLLERDLVWLSDEKRMGENVPPERKQFFEIYRNALVRFVSLNGRDAEGHYRKSYGSVLSERKFIQGCCSDPEKLKGAGRFALTLIAGALFALWAIKDFRNKSLSVATLGLLGSVMLLAGSRSKMKYIASKEFGEATKNGLDGEKLSAFYDAAKRYPSAFKEAMEEAKRNGGHIPREKKHLLTDPKGLNGKPLKQYRLDEETAELFVSEDCPPLKVLDGIFKSRHSQGKQVAIEFADTNYKNSGETARELQQATL